MTTLVYVHGFLSSPQSVKALQTQQWLSEQAPHISFRCPYLSPYPLETQQQLRALMDELRDQPVGLIGSSLGGFWSTWLAEEYRDCHLRAVLINPSVRPFELVDRVEGIPQHNFHTDDSYLMTREHAEQFLQAYRDPLQDLSRYYLMAQTDDETLDYRQAVERYRGCRQLVEQGGDHSFQGFETHLPEIVDFLFDD